MANGVLTIQGEQFNLPQGTIQHGIFNIPFSTVSQSTIVPANTTNSAIPVPPGCNGVALIPNNTAGMTLAVGFVSNQLAGYSIVNPTYMSFNPAQLPFTLYISISNTAGASCTVLFW